MGAVGEDAGRGRSSLPAKTLFDFRLAWTNSSRAKHQNIYVDHVIGEACTGAKGFTSMSTGHMTCCQHLWTIGSITSIVTPTPTTRSPTMQPSKGPGNAANLLLHQTALCCSITIADTCRKFDLQEAHVHAIQKTRMNDPVIVNFHIASIANQYAEACATPTCPVFVLPSTIFAEWRSKAVTNPISEISRSYDLSKSEHVAFPYYWESQERWLLVLLASFGDLLGHEDVTAVDAANLNFVFVILDAQHSTTKVQYSTLLRPFRDFTTALLTPRLDVHYSAISGAKLSVPSVRAAAAILCHIFTTPTSAGPCFKLH